MPAEHLLILTRYPEPGKAKTRLIPALGAEGAAQVHRCLTLYTLAQVRAMGASGRSDRYPITLYFAGNSLEQMQQWLGPDLDYQPQSSGDLGDRLTAAFQTAFDAGATRVMAIGTDCPGIDAALLRSAFQRLETADVVLGPATDGGYYLIALGRMVPELFAGIAWSTEQVFAQTVAIAQSLHLRLSTLPTLPDIDRPQDLPVWEDIRHRTLSVVLPVLNESHTLSTRLRELQPSPTLEVIVVDGGSQDDTVAIAHRGGATVLHSPAGRSRQMNLGAANARGNHLLFLHADTRLPPDFADLVRQTLAQPGVVLGAFELRIDGKSWGLRLVEWGVKWRSRLFHLPYGDQALFLTAATFQKVGGFPEQPIMEDFVLVQRLRRQGRVAIAPATVLTSARRWEKLGIWRTTLMNQFMILGYYLGIPLERLANWYRHR